MRLFIRLSFSLFFISGTLFSSVSLAGVSALEKLVMPGEVIQGHAEYEGECAKCHGDDAFSDSDQSPFCLDCHEKVAEDVKKKKGFHGRSKIVENRMCKTCHTDHKGRDVDVVGLDAATFDHDVTDFKLRGVHQQATCDNCHKPPKDKTKPLKHRDAPSKCYSCHKDDDVHKEKLGGECQKCHSEVSWTKMKFDHDKTDFPLKGRHEEATCDSCHPDNKHKDTPTKCYSCHAINDAHNKRYGEKCQTCHSEKDWDKVHFDHNKKTKFKINGKHKDVACDSCHTHKKGSIFTKKNHPKKTCNSCHKNDDVHRGQNGTKCNKCHSETEWKKSKFDHNRDTKFKIKGKHKPLKCVACHPSGKKKKGKKKKLSMDCYSCHKLDDTHKGQQGKLCNDCHSEQGWAHKVHFNHDITSFPLLGQHAIIPCEECHLTSAFKDASKDCVRCHEDDDSHKRTMGSKCNVCHNPNGWSFWRFDHDRQTDFKLEFSHKGLQCNACHKKAMGEDVEQSSTCVVCHRQDDIHGGKFGSRCDQCHTSDKFEENKLFNGT